MTTQPTSGQDDYPNDEIARLWQEQETTMDYATNPREVTKLVASIKSDFAIQKRRVLFLNIREIIPAVAMTCLFGWWAIADREWRFGVASLLCFGVGLFLFVSTLTQHQAEQHFESTVRGSIEKSLSHSKWALWMYRNVGWWYFAPLLAAIAFMYVGVVDADPDGWKLGDGVMWAALLALFAALYWWNQRIARTKYQPEITRFEGLLKDLDE